MLTSLTDVSDGPSIRQAAKYGIIIQPCLSVCMSVTPKWKEQTRPISILNQGHPRTVMGILKVFKKRKISQRTCFKSVNLKWARQRETPWPSGTGWCSFDSNGTGCPQRIMRLWTPLIYRNYLSLRRRKIGNEHKHSERRPVRIDTADRTSGPKFLGSARIRTISRTSDYQRVDASVEFWAHRSVTVRKMTLFVYNSLHESAQRRLSTQQKRNEGIKNRSTTV